MVKKRAMLFVIFISLQIIFFTLNCYIGNIGILRITNYKELDYTGSFSPDGEKIAIVSSKRSKNAIDAIYIFEKNKINPYEVNIPFIFIRDVDWSPDGNQLVFVKKNINTNGTIDELWVINLLDEKLRLIIKDIYIYIYNPDWSPDGSKLVYTADKLINNRLTRNIYVTDIINNSTVMLTDVYTEVEAIDIEPAWSNNGEKIAFSSNRNDDNFEIYIMNADGSNIERITRNGYSDRSPFWFPGDEQLGYLSAVKKPEEIFAYDFKSKKSIQITHNNIDESNPILSPDGNILAFTSDHEGNLEVYLMGLNNFKIDGFKTEKKYESPW